MICQMILKYSIHQMLWLKGVDRDNTCKNTACLKHVCHSASMNWKGFWESRFPVNITDSSSASYAQSSAQHTVMIYKMRESSITYMYM